MATQKELKDSLEFVLEIFINNKCIQVYANGTCNVKEVIGFDKAVLINNRIPQLISGE